MIMDLCDRVFGRWTVINRASEQKRRPHWLCRCVCGNEKVIDQRGLLNGKSRSCGCLQRERSRENNLIDLIGQRFGRWMVLKLSYAEKRKVYWLCRCDCGIERMIDGSTLRNGQSKSCGCYSKDLIRERQLIDLTGQKFGRWLVLHYSHTKDNRVYWLCRCICGIEKNVLSNRLRNGASTSCGCYKLEINRGQNSRFWRGGSNNGYPLEWTDELREFIRNRDHRKCQYPECDYDDTREQQKLSVHHIDSHKKNCNGWNLISICNKHHSQVENNPVLWQPYFYEITSDYEAR